MAAITVGSVSVSVVPDARGFPSKLRAELSPLAKTLGQEIGRSVAGQIADQISASVVEGVRAGGTSSRAPATKAGDDAGGAFGTAFRRRVEAALAALPDAKITADSSEADRKIADLRDQLRTLGDARIGVDIDDARAVEELRRIRGELDELGAASPSLQVRADTAAAAAQLEAIQVEAERLGAESPTITVDVDGAGAAAEIEAIGGAANSSSSGMGNLLAAGIALGPALIPVAAAIAAAFAGIGAGVAAGVAAIGVTALGFSGLTAAVKAYDSAESSAGATAVKAAGQQAQIASAQASLANARASAADGAVRSAEQVAAAERAVGQARQEVVRAEQEGARDVAQAVRRQQDAERTLIDAQKAATQAQKDLTQARADAQKQLRDLTLQSEDAALAVRDAQLSVTEAAAELQATLADPKADATARARAQLRFDEAVQQLKEQKIRTQDLAATKAAADKAGVDGSALVLRAQDGVAQANQRVGDAQRGVKDAAQGVADAQQKAAQRIADAQQRVADAQIRVSDAVRAQATQQRQSAFSIAQAQRSLAQAYQQTGTTGSAAMSKLQEAMAKLTPEGRAFVTFLRGTLLPQLSTIRRAAQSALLPGVQRGATAALPAIPVVRGAVAQVAGATGKQFEAAGRAAGGPFWTSFIRSAGTFLAAGVPIVAGTLGNVLKGLAGIARDAAPFLLEIGRDVEGLSDRFASFGTGAGGQKVVTDFFDYLKTNGPQIKETAEAVAGALKSIGGGALLIAPTSLSGIRILADVVAGMSPSQVRDLALAYVAFKTAVGVGSVVSNAASAMKTLGAITTGVRAAMIGATLAEESSTAAKVANRVATIAISAATKAYAAGQWLLNAALTANPIGLVVVAIALLVAGIIIAYQHSETFRKIVNSLWDGLKNGALTAVSAVLGAFDEFLGGVQSVLTGLGHLPGKLGAPFRDGAKAIQGARDKITDLKTGIDNLKGKAVTVSVNIKGRDISFTAGSAANLRAVEESQAGRAMGGWVPGHSPGDRSDNIPATIAGRKPLWLTGEEFVINRPTARTLQKQYPGFLDALNAGLIDVGGDPAGMTTRFGKPLGFAAGGSIPAVQSFLASTDPLPYVWGAVGPHSYDCSGLAGEAFNRLTGRASYHRAFTTSSNFGALGFQRGTGSAFVIGVNPGTHMDVNLAGFGAEAQSTATGIKVGSAATPVTRFAQQWFLPQVGGKFISSGGGPAGQPPLTAAQIAATVRFVEPAIAASVFRELNVNQFDSGGMLEPGWNLAYNGLGEREHVLTGAQMDGLAGARGGDTKHVTYENHFNYQVRPLTGTEVVIAQSQAEALS